MSWATITNLNLILGLQAPVRAEAQRRTATSGAKPAAKKSYSATQPAGADLGADAKKKTWFKKSGVDGEQRASSGTSEVKSLMFEIKSLNESGRYERAREAWLKGREKGLAMDEYVYATILSTYRHLQDWAGALEIYEEVKAKNIRNTFIESQIVDVYARKEGTSKIAVDKFYDCLKSGIEIKPYAFYAIIKALLHEGQDGEAVGMVTQHTTLFEQTDRNFWLSVVSAFTSHVPSSAQASGGAANASTSSAPSAHKEGCRSLTKHILDLDLQLQQPSWLALLTHFGNTLPQEKEDVALFKRLVTHLESLGALGLSTLIVFKMERNDAAGALEVWQQLKQTPSFFSANAFSHLISVCAASGHVEQVEEIYTAMIAHGYDANSVVLAAMVRLYASNLRDGEAQKYFDLLLSKPSYVSPFLFNTMLDMYAELGNVEQALAVVEKMNERQMKLNASTYNALITLHLRSSNPEKAAQVYKDMVKNKIPSNFATFRPFLVAADSPIAKETLLKDIKASKFISDAGKSILKQLKPNQL